MAVPERTLAALGEGLAQRAGDLLPALVRALTADLDAVDVLAGGDAGWVGAFSLEDSTAPGWLGQLAGVPYTAASPEATRAAVRGQGFTRGTVPAILAAAAATLGGTRRVDLVERDGSAYAARVITYAAETPDPAATLAAVQAAAPAGVILRHDVREGWTWDQVLDAGSTWDAVLASGLTWNQFRASVPPMLGNVTWRQVSGRTWRQVRDSTWRRVVTG